MVELCGKNYEQIATTMRLSDSEQACEVEADYLINDYLFTYVKKNKHFTWDKIEKSNLLTCFERGEITQIIGNYMLILKPKLDTLIIINLDKGSKQTINNLNLNTTVFNFNPKMNQNNTLLLLMLTTENFKGEWTEERF